MAANGLRIAKSQGMEGFTGNTSNYPISTSNTNPIFVGDPVVLSGGYCQAATSASAAILGVFMGWEDTGVTTPYGSKSKNYSRHWSATSGASANKPMAKVAIPPNGMFWIYGDGPMTATASIGAAHAFTIAAGNTQFGDSRWSLAATPAAGPVIVHRLVEQPGNAWSSATPLVEVSVNLQSETFNSAS